MFTPLIFWVVKTISHWACSDGYFFCQALKHSGRLIKSIPQAAAPIGSHNEKYTQSLSYITRKMRGCFEVHQSSFLFFSSFFFVFWLPPRRQLEPRWWNRSQKRRNERGLLSRCSCPERIAWLGVALLHPHHPCFPQVFHKQKDVRNDKALDLEDELVIFPLTHYRNYRRVCSAAVSFSLQVKAEASQSWLTQAIWWCVAGRRWQC